ncbi:MAG: 3-hydroxyacyl-ACP dehydratase FabZ family protein [Thermoguttaceae bacterium]
MHFSLIDRIEALEPGQSIVATKSLSLTEEYLQDHFPNFPVMPGVLMIEALTQASAWLIRVSDHFAHSMVLLKELKNVKYGKFVQPGQTVQFTAKIVSRSDDLTTVKAEGTIEGQTNVRAQLTLKHYNLAGTQGFGPSTDRDIIVAMKEKLSLLWSTARDAV